ncbi:MAG: protein translocase subunit SecDF [Bacteroidales bacterium]|jgi:SecD/SecF fusion protein|nr:protein translocase subunit SecDF [Bacteroidales bacterium]MBP5764594.1 protein translocase subunit SecDF [Bacteroidales bacterium]
MQNKGFVSVFGILLALVCCYHISYSFAVRNVENKAHELAVASNNETSEKYYLDSLTENWTWFGDTYKQAQEKQIGLGLDLKGGMNVILEISVSDVLKSLAAENADDPTFVEALAKTQSAQTTSGDEFLDAFASNFREINPNARLAKVFSTYQLKDKVKKDSPDSEVLSVIKKEMQAALGNSFNVLRNRIDRFGVVAPNIQQLEQAGRILVELPGVKEPERVKKLLQGSANLEFWETYSADEVYNYLVDANAHLAAGADKAASADAENAEVAENAEATVADTASADAALDAALAAADTLQQNADRGPLFNKLQLYAGFGGVAFANATDTAAVMKMLNEQASRFPRRLAWAWDVKGFDPQGGKRDSYFVLYALKGKGNDNTTPSLSDATVGGDIIVDANHEYQQLSGQYEVNMTMTPEASAEWSKITGANIGKAVAVVLDGLVYSAPRVNQQIDGGRSNITGNFSLEEATDLANVLNSGKMAAAVNIVSEDVVGPSLGQEAIEASVISFIVALVLLFIYMICFYGFKAGLVADICLIINAFFTIGILTSFHAVLTLSGIAGIVLAMGIAVDANVLIYERAKEELASGKALAGAVSAAYSNAFSAIFDANLTSLLTGIILYVFGTGPIQGFAFTFMWGIVTSFISAVFFSRIFIESSLKGWFKNVTFTGVASGLLKPTHYDFVKAGKKSQFVYAAIAVVCVILLFFPGMEKGIDFTGGRNFIVSFNDVPAVETAKLQSALENNATLNGASIKVITISNENQVRVSTNFDLNAADDEQATITVKKAIFEAGQSLGYVAEGQDFDSFNNEDYIPSSQKVGPSIAEDITRGAIIAILVALVVIALYILIRFRNIAFSLGALIGLAANVLVILGVYSSFWAFMPFSMEIDQAFIAAILTVIGYSINDIVVVFDRIREVRSLYPTKPLADTINEALNITMPRTLNTSISTLLVLIVIFFFGGASIRSFIFAMLLGVVVDPLTTIFLAVPSAYAFMNKKADKKA